MTDKTETMGARIRIRRKELGLTLKQLGEMVEASLATISLWERDESEPSGRRLVRLAQALECDIDWLMTGGCSQSYSGVFSIEKTSTALDHQAPEAEQIATILSLLPEGERSEILNFAQKKLENHLKRLSDALTIMQNKGK
jgi:transcriptional regulator with XRE-family HTH domain